jgi:hypothetical protein
MSFFGCRYYFNRLYLEEAYDDPKRVFEYVTRVLRPNARMVTHRWRIITMHLLVQRWLEDRSSDPRANKPPRRQNPQDGRTEETLADNIRDSILWSKHRIVYIRPSYSAELRHCVCESNTNTRRHRTLECTNSFWPDDWVCRSCTGSSYNQGKMFHYCVWDGDEDDIADYCCAFNCLCY